MNGANRPDFSSYIQEKHGIDQELINGILYFDRYNRVLHHPYYSGEKSLPGSIVLSGISYDEVQFNYDIHSQYLVLDYEAVSGSLYKIILSPAHTDAFHLDGEYFEKLSLDDHGPLFYQVIRVNGLTCYIHWEKKIISMSYQFEDYFTDPQKSYFLDYHGKLSPFTNRKNFVSLFSGDPKKEIRRYMWKNEVQLSEATPKQLEDLLKFISSRVQSTSGN
ncbi:hypothetical protein ACFLTU_06475 [Bacteroidota bacterium]